MPKEKQKKLSDKLNKRTIELSIFSEKRPKPTALKFSPSFLDHYISVQIDPIYNTHLNDDQVIYFDLSTGANEYMSFPETHQFCMEILSKITKLQMSDQSKSDGLLDDSLGIYFPPCSSALSFFDKISIQYQMKDQTNETSMHWPYPAQFLQLQAASDLIFSSSAWRNLQKTLGNYAPSNVEKVQDPTIYKPIAQSKLHENDSDKPPTSFNGKFLYGSIPCFPFQLVSNHFKESLFFPRKILLPPQTNIRVAFRKQEYFNQKSRMEYTRVSVNDITSNQAISEDYSKYGTGGNEWKVDQIKTEILSMKMCVEKILVEPKFDPYRDLKIHSYMYSYSRYVTHPFTSHSSIQIPIKWDTASVPLTMEFFFLRDQDLNYESSMKCPVTLNRFYLPKQLESWEIRQKDQDKLFDNLYITELNKNNVNISKQNYLEYMKRSGFLPRETKFEEVFSCNITTKTDTGTRNIYPVSFIARKVPTSLIHKGLILFLKFDGSLSSENSKWQLITKFNYISEAFCKKLPDNLQFDFKKEETFDEQIKI